MRMIPQHDAALTFVFVLTRSIVMINVCSALRCLDIAVSGCHRVRQLPFPTACESIFETQHVTTIKKKH